MPVGPKTHIDTFYSFCHFEIQYLHQTDPTMPDSTALESLTAIVTGASSGIGRAVAEQLGAAGAHVFLTGRTVAAMENCKESIEKQGGKATVIQADLRDISQVSNPIDTAIGATGRLDIMVNNAGLEFPASIIDGDPEDWRTMLETNVLALLVGCQAAVKAMRVCGASGHIVNVSSVSAQRRNSGVYGATKHAVNVVSASLRDELEADTIRVTNVCLLYTSPSPRDQRGSRMPSSA